MILAPPRPGAAAPLDPGWGGSAPRPLRSCGAEVEGGRGVGLSRGCKGCEGCLSKGCEWLGLGNRLRRFPKGFWGMVGYGGERVGERVRGIGNRSGAGGVAGKDGPGGRRRPQRPGGGAAGAQSARKGAARGLGPRPRLWFWGRALPGPKTPPPPRGVAGRGRKGASTPHSDALALQFFGKMGTIARWINL